MKKIGYWVKAYEISNNRDLLDIYKRPSLSKQCIVRNIRNLMHYKGGYDLRFTTYNAYFFSCGWRYMDKDGEEYLVYHTPSNTYEIQLSLGG